MIKTTSPEIGQRLKELIIGAGYQFRNEFAHIPNTNTSAPLSEMESEFMEHERYGITNPFREYPPALTMGELWAMLPKRFYNDYNSELHIRSSYYSGFHVWHFSDERALTKQNEKESDCDCLARIAIWCIKNNHPLNIPKND